MTGPSAPQEPDARPSGAEDALDRRLRSLTEALDQRRDADAQARRRRESTPNGGAMSTGMRALSELVGSVLVGGGVGWGIDVLTGRGPWGVLIGLTLGVVAGFWSVYRLAAGLPPTPPTQDE
jgi:ATP synthase protein I